MWAHSELAGIIRWGILSTARAGRERVIPAIQRSRNGVVATIASRDRSRAEALARAVGAPGAYGSYAELLADPNIDAVYNPLPNSMHAEWSLQCAEAGKPTLCEKPLARTAAEAQQVVDEFARRGIPLSEGFMYRFHPQTQRVKQIVDSGTLGKLKVIKAAFTFFIDDEQARRDIRMRKELAGGALMDVGCYCVNVMRLMTGEEPVDAAAAAVDWPSGVDETLVGVLRFPSGVLGHFECSLRGHFNHSYEILGTEGRIAVEQGFVIPADRTTVIRHWTRQGYQQISVEPASSYTLMVEDFADALLNRRAPRFPADDAVANMAAIDRLRASML